MAIIERFKNIPNYNGRYTISNLGRVFSELSGIYLSPRQNRNNKIWTVGLYKKGKTATFSCARLVALTWLYNSDSKLYIYAICINGDTNDFTITNVMWGSAYQSVQRKWNRHPELRKMPIELIPKLIETSKLGYSLKQLSDIFPIAKSQIADILKQNK